MRLSTICESIIGDFEDAEMEVMILVFGFSIDIKNIRQYQRKQNNNEHRNNREYGQDAITFKDN